MKWLLKTIKYLLILGFLGGLSGALLVAGAYFYLEPDLPAIDNLREVQLQVPLRVYSADDKLIAEFGEKRRMPVTFEETPELMIQAFLAAEDANFFSHPGVDYRGLLRAGIQLALTGKRRQGGSTITMQVARNFYLSREKTFLRKFNEIFLALKIERELSKEEILALYLNKIYLGHRSYGVGAAAQVYYNKSLDQLDLSQIAMIAGLPKAPSKSNPVTDPARAVLRRNYVLGRMRELGYIDETAYQAASYAPVTAQVHATDVEAEAPYVAEMVRSEMLERYGQDAYNAGFVVRTTLRSDLQESANRSLRKALDDYDRRHGYRGAEAHLEELPDEAVAQADLLTPYGRVGSLRAALVVEIKEKEVFAVTRDNVLQRIPWAGLSWAAPYVNEDRRGPAPKTAADILKPGDVIRIRTATDDKGNPHWRLAQIPTISGAMVALAPDDGRILALVGGYDFYQSKFNRAVQAHRQPGSGFKAFIYSAALDAGYTPASLINDAPVVFDDPSLEGTWRPENYSGKFFGPTRMRFALTKSRNLVSIRLLRQMGIEHALKHIAKFGFNIRELPRNLSLALGSGAVTPLEMARGYAVLANGGYLIEPHVITSIAREGEEDFVANPARVCEPPCAEVVPPAPQAEETLDEEEPAQMAPAPPRFAPRVLDEQNRFIMYSMMQDVITAGTARRARALGRRDLAGKTGTTNDQRDAWFNGYNQSLVAVVWVGFDSNAKLGRGEVGGRAALPAWMDFMRVALKDMPDEPPNMPQDMVMVRIDPQTGLRARAGQPGSIFEVFRAGNEPKVAEIRNTATPIGSDNGRGGRTPPAVPPVEDLF